MKKGKLNHFSFLILNKVNLRYIKKTKGNFKLTLYADISMQAICKYFLKTIQSGSRIATTPSKFIRDRKKLHSSWSWMKLGHDHDCDSTITMTDHPLVILHAISSDNRFMDYRMPSNPTEIHKTVNYVTRKGYIIYSGKNLSM